MSKAPRKRYDLAKIIASELAKTKPITITAGERTITVKPPVLWPDEVFAVDDVASAKILMGEDYDAYVDAGGTARLFFGVIVPDWQGATVPESPASTD